MQTKVELTCVSKKESKNLYSGDTAAHPKSYEIELEVGYDPTSVYYKMSGGTNMPLRTINQDAAAMFEVGQKYMMTIEPVPAEEKGE